MQLLAQVCVYVCIVVLVHIELFTATTPDHHCLFVSTFFLSFYAAMTMHSLNVSNTGPKKEQCKEKRHP